MMPANDVKPLVGILNCNIDYVTGRDGGGDKQENSYPRN